MTVSYYQDIFEKADSVETRTARIAAYAGVACTLTKSRRAVVDAMLATADRSSRYWANDLLSTLRTTKPSVFRAVLWATCGNAVMNPQCVLNAYEYGEPCALCGRFLVTTSCCVLCKRDRYKEWLAINRADAVSKATATNLARYGVANVGQVESVKRHIRRIHKARYGGSPMKDPLVRAKAEATNRERYGGNAPANSPLVIARMKATCLERYGVANPAQCSDVIEKMKRTNLRRYGVDNVALVDGATEKARHTNLVKYGGLSGTCTPEVQDKRKATCLKKYGVDHHSKDPSVHRAQAITGYQIKELTLNRRVFRYQGWEDVVIRKVVKRFGPRNVATQYDGAYPDELAKILGWIPDLWIKDKGFIEVKSDYTLGCTNDKILKRNAQKARTAAKVGIKVLWCVVLNPKTGEQVTLPNDWWRHPKRTLRSLNL